MNENNRELTINDYIEIIKALPPKALTELLRRYKAGLITNDKTIVALSFLHIV